MRLFESGGDARFVWDQSAHDRWDEDCYFYVLRAPDPSDKETLNTALNRLLRREDITSHSLYVLFGFYDALVRLWATPTVRKRFLRALNMSSIAAEDILEFRTEKILYSFATVQPERGGVRQAELAITSVSGCELADAWEPGAAETSDGILVARARPEFETAPDHLAALQRSGLVHLVPVADGTKFYVALRADRPGRAPNPREPRQICDLLAEAGVGAASVYSGIGLLGEYLVKGVAPFDELVERLEPLFRFAKERGLRYTTFPIANTRTAIEVDVIDQIRIRSTIELDDLVAEVAEADAEVQEKLWPKVVELSMSERHALLAIYQTYAPEFRNTPFESRLRALLRSSLLNDPDGIDEAIAVPLLSTEKMLRRLLPRVYARSIGSQWFHDVRSLGVQARAESESEAGPDGRTGDSWLANQTLFSLLTLLARAEKEWPSVRSFVESVFPDGWTNYVTEISNLRNALAHGRLTDRERFTDFDGGWGTTLGEILMAARLFVGLRQAQEFQS